MGKAGEEQLLGVARRLGVMGKAVVGRQVQTGQG